MYTRLINVCENRWNGLGSLLFDYCERDFRQKNKASQGRSRAGGSGCNQQKNPSCALSIGLVFHSTSCSLAHDYWFLFPSIKEPANSNTDEGEVILVD